MKSSDLGGGLADPAVRQALEILCDALSEGMLDAYVSLDDHFYRIPVQYWEKDPWRDARFNDRLVTNMDLSGLIPSKFANQPVVLLDEDVRKWMRGKLPRRPSKTRKTRYDWSAFEAEAVRRLDYEGDFREDWLQSDLERQMTLWCENDDGWEKSPVASHIRLHVKRAHATFLEQRAKI